VRLFFRLYMSRCLPPRCHLRLQPVRQISKSFAIYPSFETDARVQHAEKILSILFNSDVEQKNRSGSLFCLPPRSVILEQSGQTLGCGLCLEAPPFACVRSLASILMPLQGRPLLPADAHVAGALLSGQPDPLPGELFL